MSKKNSVKINCLAPTNFTYLNQIFAPSSIEMSFQKTLKEAKRATQNIAPKPESHSSNAEIERDNSSSNGHKSQEKDQVSDHSRESNESYSQESSDENQDDARDDEEQKDDVHKKGLGKLFDLMKNDLGQQQTNLLKNFYKDMSSQIKTMICQPTSAGSAALAKNLGANLEEKDQPELQIENIDQNVDASGAAEDQSQLNQVFLLSLLQFQKQKILEESAGMLGQDKQDKDQDEDEGEDVDQSSSEEVVYDERVGEPCLVDELPKSQTAGQSLQKNGLRVKCLLKPVDEVTSKYLKEKSSNNINPYVIVETETGTSINTLIEHMATKLFMEDKSKISLQVHQSRFNCRKSSDLSVQEMMLAEEPDKLEAALEGDKTIKLSIKYAIKGVSKVQKLVSKSKNSSDHKQKSLKENNELSSDAHSNSEKEDVDVPNDLSETELMEMLTEVMSIMLFNKDEKLNQYVGSVNEFDLKAKLPHPSDLLGKRRRKKKTANGVTPDYPKDNEKSEQSHASVQQRRLAKAMAKEASKKLPFQERLNEYQKNQRIKLDEQRQKRDQQVQHFGMRKQHQMRQIVEKYCQTGEQFDPNMVPGGLISGVGMAQVENFASVQEMMNFRLNPYFDNLIRFSGQ